MTPFLQYLADKQLPGYALLKNAVTQFVPEKGYQISGFDEAHWSNDMEELVTKIPKPVLQNTREAKEYSGYRFSPEELKAEDFHFDTMPSALLNEANDMTVFGESYTILWVAEPEEEWLQASIIQLFNARTQEKIGESDILEVWDKTINRIFFRTRGDEEVSLVLIFDDLISSVVDAINALPNGPDEATWDALNEFGFSDEEG
jgi:hypothetical protein